MPPELERFVAEKVESGEYGAPIDVVTDALRLLEQQAKIRRERLSDFEAELESRLAALDRGEEVSPDVFWNELRARSEAVRKSRT